MAARRSNRRTSGLLPGDEASIQPVRVMSSVVPPGAAGLSLADWLTGRFTYGDRLQWLAFIQEGCLTHNGQVADSDLILQAGDVIGFTPPAQAEPPVDREWRLEYEDEACLVVDKPPLLPIHPAGRYFAHSLWYLLRQVYSGVHCITRLDRETSGLVLVAKTAEAARQLQASQAAGNISKDYLALVYGHFPLGQTRLAAGWLASDSSSQVRKKRCFTSQKPGHLRQERCSTRLLGLEAWQDVNGWRSLVQASLDTGRTHQIRATLLSLGYPLVGDRLYGLDDGCFLRFAEGRLTEADRHNLELPWQALQCSSLEFPSPAGNMVAVRLDSFRQRVAAARWPESEMATEPDSPTLLAFNRNSSTQI